MEKKFKIKPVAGTMFVSADESGTTKSGLILPSNGKVYNEDQRIIEVGDYIEGYLPGDIVRLKFENWAVFKDAPGGMREQVNGKNQTGYNWPIEHLPDGRTVFQITTRDIKWSTLVNPEHYKETKSE
jgi:co-chaperonin GroES (HSP10)